MQRKPLAQQKQDQLQQARAGRAVQRMGSEVPQREEVVVAGTHLVGVGRNAVAEGGVDQATAVADDRGRAGTAAEAGIPQAA